MDLREFASETTIERESCKLAKAPELMEESSAAVTTFLKKRKAELDLAEETEESGVESGDDYGEETYESEEEGTWVKGPCPQWDVDSFDGVDYHSSDEFNEFSEEEQDKDKLCREFKRQIIASKGFYVDPELNTWSLYSDIKVIRNLDQNAAFGQTYREYFAEMARLCLNEYNKVKSKKNGFNVEFVEVVRGYYRFGERSKSYITFKAKEQPDGPDVEYQAKAWCTYNEGENYPILCRPAPPMAKLSKLSKQNE